jgi:hypothetical protein
MEAFTVPYYKILISYVFLFKKTPLRHSTSYNLRKPERKTMYQWALKRANVLKLIENT